MKSLLFKMLNVHVCRYLVALVSMLNTIYYDSLTAVCRGHKQPYI